MSGITVTKPTSTGITHINQDETPTVTGGDVWALRDANGDVYSAGFQGATQKHPLPLTGGQRIDLSILPESATVGWSQTTGTGVVQTVDGLEVTLNAGNPDVSISLPFFGSPWVWGVSAEVGIVCAAPGNGDYVGIELDTGSDTHGFILHSDAVDWRCSSNRNSVITRSTANPIALGSLGSVGYINGNLIWHTTILTVRIAGVAAGVLGTAAPLSTHSSDMQGDSVTGAPGMALKLYAHWASGDDIVLKFGSVAVQGNELHLSTID